MMHSRRAVGSICGLFQPRECWNFLKHAGYASEKVTLPNHSTQDAKAIDACLSYSETRLRRAIVTLTPSFAAVRESVVST